MPPTTLTAAQHRRRAVQHRELGGAPASRGIENEWAAVAFFYAAYHDVKAALLDDPIFDDLGACHAVSSALLPADRHASSHKARKGSGRGLGVNDVVSLLYPRAAGTYEFLPQLSIDVRYKNGLRPGALEKCVALNEKFTTLALEGALSSGTRPGRVAD